MGFLARALGLPEHAECGDCGTPIAKGHQTRQGWTAAPLTSDTDHKMAHNRRDGSINLDGTACDDSTDGRHHPRDGSLW